MENDGRRNIRGLRYYEILTENEVCYLEVSRDPWIVDAAIESILCGYLMITPDRIAMPHLLPGLSKYSRLVYSFNIPIKSPYDYGTFRVLKKAPGGQAYFIIDLLRKDVGEIYVWNTDGKYYCWKLAASS